jgi:folate-binding Fe-S cluster repair protein YgfZ
VKIVLDGPSPEAGATILAGDKQVGTIGSTAGDKGLALVRTDRVAEALAAGLTLSAGGLPLRLADPDAVRNASKQGVA